MILGIRSLLSKYDGIDLNAVFHSSTFTLIQAIKSESDAALKCLYEWDFSQTMIQGWKTALHIACRKDMGAAVKLLKIWCRRQL